MGIVDLDRQVRLYVNGTPMSDGTEVVVPGPERWAAEGRFAIGRGYSDGAPAERWTGDIDEVNAAHEEWTDEEIDFASRLW